MRNEISIKSLLDAVTVPADWVGIREVYESNTPRMIRDGVPVSNGHYATHGAMIEVLVNGQFGYFGTPDLSKNGIELASKKAFDQAKAASRYSLHTFTDEVRPKNIGKYSSPFEKDLRSISAKDLNMLLLNAYKNLKPVFKIFSLDKEKPKFGISSFVSLKVIFGLYFLHICATSLTVTVSLVKLKS